MQVSHPRPFCPVRLMAGPLSYTQQKGVRFPHRVRARSSAARAPPRHGGYAGANPAAPTAARYASGEAVGLSSQ